VSVFTTVVCAVSNGSCVCNWSPRLGVMVTAMANAMTGTVIAVPSKIHGVPV
jgi:hypothetical protein